MITVKFAKVPPVGPGSLVLDVGCGSGRHVCEAIRNPGVTAVGIDRSLSAVAQARKNLRLVEQVGEGPGTGEVLLGDVTRLPFPDDFFDLVICSEVLEHVEDDATAICELARVLKPSKDLVVSVPRFLPERLCWLLSRDYYERAGGHLRIYRQRELSSSLQATGLQQWGSHFAHGLHSPYWWLKCLVGPTKDRFFPVDLYHRFLVWDMMKRPWLSRALEAVLNPLCGKSIVLYLRKPAQPTPIRVS